MEIHSENGHSDRLPEAIAEVSQALGAFPEGQDWPNALPAMSTLGVMHFWRGEYPQAHALLSQARALRQRLHGGGGIKIDIHLGAVRYELGQADEAADLRTGDQARARQWAVAAGALQARCAPFDMPAQEVATMLAAVAAMASSSAH